MTERQAEVRGCAVRVDDGGMGGMEGGGGGDGGDGGDQEKNEADRIAKQHSATRRG